MATEKEVTQRYLWTIKGFQVSKNVLIAKSPLFCYPHDSKMFFYLSIAVEKGATIDVFKFERNKYEVRVGFQFYDSRGSCIGGVMEIDLEKSQRRSFNKDLFGNFLKLEFDATVFLTPGNEGYQMSNIIQCSLTEDLSTLFKDGRLSDLIVQVEEKEFAVHKVLLGGRSLVFRKMFESNMKEAINNKVVIKGFTPNTVENMLKFIYTDKIDNLKSNTSELLTIADQYGLDRLKSMCEIEMSTNLEIKNVVDSLLQADFLNAKDLKYHALRFIKANRVVIIQSKDWKKMTSDLLTDLIALSLE